MPTGNFGDIFAGYIAKQMGLPIADLVVATNRNDILHRTLQTGAYTKEGVEPTISPSMDIQVSSNFERALFDAYGRDGAAVAGQMDDLKKGGFEISQGAYQMLKDTFKSGRASEEETHAAIKTYLATTTANFFARIPLSASMWPRRIWAPPRWSRWPQPIRRNSPMR